MSQFPSLSKADFQLRYFSDHRELRRELVNEARHIEFLQKQLSVAEQVPDVLLERLEAMQKNRSELLARLEKLTLYQTQTELVEREGFLQRPAMDD